MLHLKWQMVGVQQKVMKLKMCTKVEKKRKLSTFNLVTLARHLLLLQPEEWQWRWRFWYTESFHAPLLLAFSTKHQQTD